MEAGDITGYWRVARQRVLRGAALSLALLPMAGNALATTAAPQNPATLENPAPLDVRVIVDASAWSDSAAQRAGLDSAITALLTILPTGTTSAVWPLGSETRETEISVAHDPAAAAPPGKRVRAATGALVTAFETLLKEWTPPSGSRRHVILLVAGTSADVHAGTAEDLAAEKRLLNELLPRLHGTRAALHVIAPSHTDTRLLQQLVVATDGWYIEASDPADAERRLLDLLENLAQHDTLLLQDGLVKFDTSVTTARLVLFRSDPNLPSRLVPPGSSGFSQFNAPSNISWRQEARFDVVTITKPTPGTWQILTDDDARHRAFADASLQLVVTAVPRNVVAGSRREFTIGLLQNGKLVTDRNVLDHVVVKASQFQGNTERRLWFPMDNGRTGDAAADDGVFTVVLDDFLPAQSYRFVTEVEGLNFQRRHQLRMDVHDQSVWAQIKPGADDHHFVVSVLPRHNLVDPEMMTVLAHLTQAGMDPRELRVPRFTSTTWRLDLELETRSARDVLEINVQATTATGQPASLWLPPMTLPAAHAPHTEPSRARSAAANHTGHMPDANTLDPVADTNATASGPTPSESWPVWLTSSLQLLSINAGLSAMGWLALRVWRRREHRWQSEIEGALAHD